MESVRARRIVVVSLALAFCSALLWVTLLSGRSGGGVSPGSPDDRGANETSVRRGSSGLDPAPVQSTRSERRVIVGQVRVRGEIRFADNTPARRCAVELIDEKTAQVCCRALTDESGVFGLTSSTTSVRDGKLALRIHPHRGAPTHRVFEHSFPADLQEENYEWVLPVIRIQDKALLRVEVSLTAPLPAAIVEHAVIVITAHRQSSIYFGLVTPVTIAASALSPGRPTVREVVIPRRSPMVVQCGIRSPWGWASVSVSSRVVALEPTGLSEYETACFQIGPENVLSGRAVDGRGEPLPQVGVELRFDNGSRSCRTVTKTNRHGEFLSSTNPNWGGRARVKYGAKRGRWKEFLPGEKLVLTFDARPLRVRVVQSSGEPPSSLSFRRRCFYTRVWGRFKLRSVRAYLRDCDKGLVFLACDRIKKGQRWFIYVPGLGEFAHVFQRNVSPDDAELHSIHLPPRPTSENVSVTFSGPELSETGSMVGLRLQEVDATDEPLSYRMSLDPKNSPVIEGVQVGIYTYKCKIENSRMQYTGSSGKLVVSAGGKPTLQLTWR